MHSPSVSRRRHAISELSVCSSVRVCVRACLCRDRITKVCEVWTRYFTNSLLQLGCSWGQRWTDYILRAKEEMLGSQWHCTVRCIPVSTLGGIFSPISGMHGCILTKFIYIGHRRPSTGLVAVQRHRQSQLLGGKFLINRSAWHYDIFKVMGSEVKVTDDIFAKMHFSGGGMLITSDLICFIA